MIVPPIKITDIPSPSSSPESETREFRLTFPAPPQANLYSFILHFVSDTWLGADVSLPVLMKVEEPPQITEINGGGAAEDEDDGISDPEEDSLAGQMALMKGGKVKKSPVRIQNEYESSEEEYSGSEGDDESNDEEEERRPKGREGKAINEDTDSEDE